MVVSKDLTCSDAVGIDDMDDTEDKTPPEESHSCPQCHKTYKRPEHLKRHLQSHSTAKQYSCPLCQATFQRSDVLKRHQQTCVGPRKRMALTKKACDQCTRRKRACDAARPCRGCVTRGAICTYSQLEQAMQGEAQVHISHGTSFWIPWHDDSSVSDGDILDRIFNFGGSTAEHEEGRIPVTLHFLERFTRDQGLVASFDCCTEEERLLLEDHVRGQLPFIDATDLTKLQQVSDQCSLLIAEVCQVKPRNSAVDISWDRATEHECRQFFSASNIYLFLELYWAIWSPNVPLLHRPTFGIGIAKPVLIAAMVTIGASVSSSEADRLAAKKYFNCVEEAVFCDDQFCTEEDRRLFPSKAKIQSLQAAYIVMLYQNWEGSTSSKGRIRRFRYSTVVAVARDVGIRHARHEIYTSATFDWQDFILREELIRVILWIFLLDTAFVIFNNVPPRMAIKEMKMSFARNDACFQASNSEMCLQQVMISHQEPRLLSSACEMICNRTITDGELASFGHLGSLNLFVATSAIHSMIFQVQQSFSPQLQLGPIYNALANWHLLWQRHIKVDLVVRSYDAALLTPVDITRLWQREGFSRFAPEYWMLASMLVQRLDRTEQNVIDKSREEPEVKIEPKDELLENYDTDMRQVNSLIAEFQKVML